MLTPSAVVSLCAIGSSFAQYPQLGLANITSVGLPRSAPGSKIVSAVAWGSWSAPRMSPSGVGTLFAQPEIAATSATSQTND